MSTQNLDNLLDKLLPAEKLQRLREQSEVLGAGVIEGIVAEVAEGMERGLLPEEVVEIEEWVRERVGGVGEEVAVEVKKRKKKVDYIANNHELTRCFLREALGEDKYSEMLVVFNNAHKNRTEISFDDLKMLGINTRSVNTINAFTKDKQKFLWKTCYSNYKTSSKTTPKESVLTLFNLVYGVRVEKNSSENIDYTVNNHAFTKYFLKTALGDDKYSEMLILFKQALEDKSLVPFEKLKTLGISSNSVNKKKKLTNNETELVWQKCLWQYGEGRAITRMVELFRIVYGVEISTPPKTKVNKVDYIGNNHKLTRYYLKEALGESYEEMLALFEKSSKNQSLVSFNDLKTFGISTHSINKKKELLTKRGQRLRWMTCYHQYGIRGDKYVKRILALFRTVYGIEVEDYDSIDYTENNHTLTRYYIHTALGDRKYAEMLDLIAQARIAKSELSYDDLITLRISSLSVNQVKQLSKNSGQNLFWQTCLLQYGSKNQKQTERLGSLFKTVYGVEVEIPERIDYTDRYHYWAHYFLEKSLGEEKYNQMLNLIAETRTQNAKLPFEKLKELGVSTNQVNGENKLLTDDGQTLVWASCLNQYGNNNYTPLQKTATLFKTVYGVEVEIPERIDYTDRYHYWTHYFLENSLGAEKYDKMLTLIAEARTQNTKLPFEKLKDLGVTTHSFNGEKKFVTDAGEVFIWKNCLRQHGNKGTKYSQRIAMLFKTVFNVEVELPETNIGLTESKDLTKILNELPKTLSKEYLLTLKASLEKIQAETDNPKIAKFLKTLQSFMQGQSIVETNRSAGKQPSLSALWKIQARIQDLLGITTELELDPNFVYQYFYPQYIAATKANETLDFLENLKTEMNAAPVELSATVLRSFTQMVQLQQGPPLLRDIDNDGFEPFGYQFHGGDYLYINDGILGFQAGLGKTNTANIALEKKLRQCVLEKLPQPEVLIVSDYNAHSQWHHDLQRLTSYEYQGQDDPFIRVISPHQLLAQVKKTGHRGKITKKAIQELYGNFDIMIVDDLFKYDNPHESNQTNFILKNIPAKTRWGLTGNLYQRHPLYAYNLFNVIDPQKYPDYKHFRRELKKDPSLIQHLISSNVLRYTQETAFPEGIDGFRPPEILHETTAIALDADYHHLLEKLARNMHSFRVTAGQIGSKVNQTRGEDEPRVKHGIKETDFTEFGKLRWYQYITNHPEEFGLPDYKFQQLLSEIGPVGAEKRTAVVCQHTKIIDKLVSELKEIYGEDAVGRYDGTNLATREDDLAKAQSGEIKILVLNEKSGGSGLTLSGMDQGIYYEAPRTNTQMEQLDLRFSRADTQNPKEFVPIKRFTPCFPEEVLTEESRHYFAEGLPEAAKYEAFEKAQEIDQSLWDTKKPPKDTDYRVYQKLHTWFEDPSIKEMRKKLRVKRELKQIKRKHPSEQPFFYMFRDILRAEDKIDDTQFERIFADANNLTTVFDFIKKSVLSPKTFHHKHVRDILSYAIPPELKANLQDKALKQTNSGTEPVLDIADLTEITKIFEFRNKFSVTTLLSHLKILLAKLAERGEKLGDYLQTYASTEEMTEKRVPKPIQLIALLMSAFENGDFAQFETVNRQFLQKINRLPEKERRNRKNYDDLFTALCNLIGDLPYYLGPHVKLTAEQQEDRSRKYTLFTDVIEKISQAETKSFKEIIFAIRDLGFVLQFGEEAHLEMLESNKILEDLQATKLELLHQTILPEVDSAEFMQHYENLKEEYKQKPSELEDDLTGICVFLKRYKQYTTTDIDYAKQYPYFAEAARLFFTQKLPEARQEKEHVTETCTQKVWELYRQDQKSHYTVKTLNNKQEEVEFKISVEDSSNPATLLRSGSKFYGLRDCHNEYAFPIQNRCVAEVALNPAIKIAVVRNKNGKPIAVGRIKLRKERETSSPTIHVEAMMNSMGNLPVEELLAYHFSQTREAQVNVTIPEDIRLQTLEMENSMDQEGDIQSQIVKVKNPAEKITLEPILNLSGVEYVEDIHLTCHTKPNFHLQERPVDFTHKAKAYQHKPACIVDKE